MEVAMCEDLNKVLMQLAQTIQKTTGDPIEDVYVYMNDLWDKACEIGHKRAQELSIEDNTEEYDYVVYNAYIELLKKEGKICPQDVQIQNGTFMLKA